MFGSDFITFEIRTVRVVMNCDLQLLAAKIVQAFIKAYESHAESKLATTI